MKLIDFTIDSNTLYFAYGSNLDRPDREAYCRRRGLDPSIMQPVGPAILPDHELTFDCHSVSRNGGVLNLRQRRGQFVDGYVFRVTKEGWSALDRKEGVQSGCYERRPTTVLGRDGTELQAITYVACADRAGTFVPPSKEYVEVCRRGRQALHLDTSMLEAVTKGKEARLAAPGLFVYGTLMRGEPRFGVMAEAGLSCILLATAIGELHNYGAWPALSLADDSDDDSPLVFGELMIPGDLSGVLRVLDRIEGFAGFGSDSNLFRRTLTLVDVDHGRLRLAWTYVADGIAADAPKIESGDWRQHHGYRGQFMQALLDAHRSGVKDFETRVAMEILPPCLSFDPEEHGLTSQELEDAFSCGDIAERRIARISEDWAKLPETVLCANAGRSGRKCS